MVAEDIIKKVRLDFPRLDEAQLVLALLHEFAEQNPALSGDRLLRCIVYVANGDLDLFAKAIELAVVDYRDLVVWAEYDENRFQIRDLSKPFEL